MFRGTPYFVATSLFDNPFSRSFKALHFSPKRLICQFSFYGHHLSEENVWRKTKNFCDVFFLTKSFRILAEMLKHKFERMRGNRPRVQQFCSTYQDIWDIKIRDIKSFLPKEVHNVQGTEEFVRGIRNFEKLSILVFESQLYAQENVLQSIFNKVAGLQDCCKTYLL